MVTIERVGAAHWARARAVRLEALVDAPDAFGATVEHETAMSETAWRRRLSRTDAATFLAADSGGDIGMAVGATHHDDPADAGLYSMWVASRARGAGVGDALVARVVGWAREHGFVRLRLEVGDHNAHAVGLYERMGFVATGVVGHLPPPREHVIEHERALRLRS